MGRLRTAYEYIISLPEKAKVLRELCPFVGVPSLHEERFDLHVGKVFRVPTFQVVREREHNWLVSPFYFNSDGTVIDWMPSEWESE